MNQPVPSIPTQISTLRDVRACLRAARLPEVSPDRWRAIREDEPAERLVQALRSVITDPASRRYLEGLVAPAGEGSGRSASSASPLSSSAADEGAAGNADYLSVHVYGGKAALCFNADTTRGGVPTVALDAAAGANRQYDWAVDILTALKDGDSRHHTSRNSSCQQVLMDL